MTVVQINDDDIACHWFDGAELKMNCYSPECLIVEARATDD